MEDNSLEKKFSKLIIAVSIIIPVLVGILFAVKLKDFGLMLNRFRFCLQFTRQ
jgi:putative membrane protein